MTKHSNSSCSYIDVEETFKFQLYMTKHSNSGLPPLHSRRHRPPSAACPGSTGILCCMRGQPPPAACVPSLPSSLCPASSSLLPSAACQAAARGLSARQEKAVCAFRSSSQNP